MPWDTPLTLIGDSPGQVAAAQRQLVRIGIDRPAGAATGDLETLTAPSQDRRHYPRVTFAAVRDMGPHDIVLDVRRDDERAAGHLPGSAHVPLHQLLARLADLPPGRLWVHCAGGFRCFRRATPAPGPGPGSAGAARRAGQAAGDAAARDRHRHLGCNKSGNAASTTSALTQG